MRSSFRPSSASHFPTRPVKRVIFVGRDETLRADMRRLRHAERLKGNIGAVVTWGTRDDAVEIAGESLGLHERHPAATRASIEIDKRGVTP